MDTRRRNTPLPILFALLLSIPVARSAAADEYKIKAAFIYNFLKFVKLPERGIARPLLFACALTRDPDLGAFEEIDGREVGERAIELVVLTEFPEPDLCDVLYIHPSFKGDIAGGLESLKQFGVLSVGERERFFEEGGIINFLWDGGRVRFDLDLSNAREQGIHLSAQLLKVAREVKGANE